MKALATETRYLFGDIFFPYTSQYYLHSDEQDLKSRCCSRQYTVDTINLYNKAKDVFHSQRTLEPAEPDSAGAENTYIVSFIEDRI